MDCTLNKNQQILNDGDDTRNPMSIEVFQYYLKDLTANFQIKIIFAYLVSIVLFIHNHVYFTFYVMIALAFIDLITGFTRAVIQKNVSSYKAGMGIVKIFLYMVIVGTGVLFDYGIFHRLPEYGFNYLVTSYIILHLAISILENLYDLGCPVPKSLISWLCKVRDRIDKDCKPSPGDLLK